MILDFDDGGRKPDSTPAPQVDLCVDYAGARLDFLTAVVQGRRLERSQALLEAVWGSDSLQPHVSWRSERAALVDELRPQVAMMSCVVPHVYTLLGTRNNTTMGWGEEGGFFWTHSFTTYRLM